jgi:TatD DNase family protein
VLFDTHCHLSFSDFEKDLPQVIKRAFDNKVKFFLNIGCDLESNRKILRLSEKYSNLSSQKIAHFKSTNKCKNIARVNEKEVYFFSSIGIHPHYSRFATRRVSSKVNEKIWQEFEKLTHKDIVAIGECGLDYYRNLSPKEKQKEIFQKQILLSKRLKLPLVIHSREAEDDLISILKDYDVKEAVVHCFSGSRHFLDFCIERKFFISFAGNITYPKAKNLRDLAKQVPLELLLLETDCPFLSPQAVRGKRCEPQYLTFIRDELSHLKSIEPEKIGEITTLNALRCFKINFVRDEGQKHIQEQL